MEGTESMTVMLSCDATELNWSHVDLQVGDGVQHDQQRQQAGGVARGDGVAATGSRVATAGVWLSL